MKIIRRFFKNIGINISRECNCTEIDYYTLQQMIRENNKLIILDVRSVQEYKEGHLLGAVNIPLSDLKKRASLLFENNEQTIIVYCQMGGRSHRAVKILQNMGYRNVFELKGGLDSI